MKLVTLGNKIPTMDDVSIGLAREAEDVMAELPGIRLETFHTLHGGIYSRTIVLKRGEVIVGAEIKVPTTLVISGYLSLYIGEEVIELEGVHIIPASKGRKQVMTALEETSVTMSFATKATTIAEAESEFTDEADKLVSRNKDAINIINITGE